MSLLSELNNRKKTLNPTDTIVTCADGRRYLESKNKFEEIAQAKFGFVVDTKPDNVPAKITDYLYIGSQDCCEDVVLKSHCITHVLSIGVEPTYKYEGVEYKFVECLDLPETNIKSVLVEECVPYIKKAMEGDCKVLVHCNAGVSRSSAIVIGFLMLENKLSYGMAYEIVKSARTSIKPNSGFENQLKKLT